MKKYWPLWPGMLVIALAGTNLTCEVIITGTSTLREEISIPSDAFLIGHAIGGFVGLLWVGICAFRNARIELKGQ